jgi:hypothetical protein
MRGRLDLIEDSSSRPACGPNALTATSAPAAVAATEAASVTSPTTAVTRGALGTAWGLRTIAITSCPRDTASARMREPIMPVAPKSAIFIKSYDCKSYYRAPPAEPLAGTKARFTS